MLCAINIPKPPNPKNKEEKQRILRSWSMIISYFNRLAPPRHPDGYDFYKKLQNGLMRWRDEVFLLRNTV